MNRAAIRTICFFFILVLAACRQDIQESALPGDDPLKDAIDQQILTAIKASQAPYDWNSASADMLWDALRITDNTLVVGFSDGVDADVQTGEELLAAARASEGVADDSDFLVYRDDVLGFFMIRIAKKETLELLRSRPEVTFTEPNEYVIDLETIGAFTGTASAGPAQRQAPSVNTPYRRDMILDPFQEDPDYIEQVLAYDAGLWEVLIRHNLDEVYRNYGVFGADIGVAVIDNGIVDWALELFLANGYGGRETIGFFNPLWFLPGTEPDGIHPQPYDALGISQLLEPQWLHGSGMVQSAFVVSPNADITCVRASTAIVVLFHSQILGISNAIRAMADRPDIRVANMSMGTIFMMHRIKNAINYYHSKGKIMACAAGTTFEEIKDLLGIIFPAYLGNTVSVTGIENREETGGEFVAGNTAHTGLQNDFCVENSAASSEATARMVGMLALIWSVNPELTREEVLEIAVQASHFYQETGQKDPDFGWGTVDMLQAVELAMP